MLSLTLSGFFRTFGLFRLKKNFTTFQPYNNYMEQHIINDYTQRVSFAQQEADKYKMQANNYSLFRLVVFGLFIVSVCVAIAVDEIFIIAFALIGLIICFSWLIKKQNGFETLKNYYLDIKTVNENEI